MKHYLAYDRDCFGKLIWHEFDSKAEAEVFAEVIDMKFIEVEDKIYDKTEIMKAVNEYLRKKKKHIKIAGGSQ